MGTLLYAWVPIDGGKLFFKGWIKAFAILSNIFESQLITDFIWKSKGVLFYHLTKFQKSKSVFMLIFVEDYFIKLILNVQFFVSFSVLKVAYNCLFKDKQGGNKFSK